ncbi:MAG TPA: 4-(cytidine 5'-diphospho)-2-C-methyl-D-erythritol kinase [Pyrinomonadaceae bacterium]|nr:4-(cytidine 5'-diphospho)-2-C-methyl-D-erythritol kinase [Pyrinomonadaceae bacterium]
MSITSLKLPSYAKINRHLDVLGKRPDGYHEVFTVLQMISLCDDLEFELRTDGKVTLVCDDPRIPTDETNLVIKAALALQQKLETPLGADIKLTKRIPAQGGLGGASSNAAVTLIGLNGLWRAPFRSPHWKHLAGELGADVPFFTGGGRMVATGIGATLLPVQDTSRKPLIIITPNARVSTPTAYAALNAGSLTTVDAMPILSSSFERHFTRDSSQWPEPHNDFERVIFEIEPEIERAKNALLEAGARSALLAGSGSSVFGIVDDEAMRERVLDNLKCEAGWQLFSCETLSRVEYYEALKPSGFPLFLRSLKTANKKTDTGA